MGHQDAAVIGCDRGAVAAGPLELFLSAGDLANPAEAARQPPGWPRNWIEWLVARSGPGIPAHATLGGPATRRSHQHPAPRSTNKWDHRWRLGSCNHRRAVLAP